MVFLFLATKRRFHHFGTRTKRPKSLARNRVCSLHETVFPTRRHLAYPVFVPIIQSVLTELRPRDTNYTVMQ